MKLCMCEPVSCYATLFVMAWLALATFEYHILRGIYIIVYVNINRISALNLLEWFYLFYGSRSAVPFCKLSQLLSVVIELKFDSLV